MLRKSPRNGRAVKVKGAKVPSISAWLAAVEAHLREEVLPSPAMLGGALITSRTPPIKPRLEALIDQAGVLRARLDQLSHTIVGDGNPPGGEAASGSKPYTIPDQLEALESLLSNCNERLEGITNRF